jgi:hypothetical protein
LLCKATSFGSQSIQLYNAKLLAPPAWLGYTFEEPTAPEFNSLPNRVARTPVEWWLGRCPGVVRPRIRPIRLRFRGVTMMGS